MPLLREIWSARKKYGMPLLGWLACVVLFICFIPVLVYWQIQEWFRRPE